MNRKGVTYDVGAFMLINWRPNFDPKIVHRELEIIKNDLHCNAVRIVGLDLNRLTTAAQYALELGLEVWLSPAMWDKSPDRTLDYVTKAALSAETLRQRWADKLVFIVGTELTLFMQGIVKGKNVKERMNNLMVKFRQDRQHESGNSTPQTANQDTSAMVARVKAAEHNKLLNEYLVKANASVRNVFHGKVTYASLLWEAVDWELFDFVGVDHYRVKKIKDQYVALLKPSFEYGKPVVITEFGVQTYQGAQINGAGLGGNIVDDKSLFFHSLPVLGKFIRPRLKGSYIRDEALQARELVDQLSVLDRAGVDGAFVSEFVSQIKPYSDNPKYDLDMGSLSLVKSYSDGRHGDTYPEMPWEPKESFRAVADYYAKH